MGSGILIFIGLLGLILLFVNPIIYSTTGAKLQREEFLSRSFITFVGFFLVVLPMILYFVTNYSSSEERLRYIILIASVLGLYYSMSVALFSWTKFLWDAD
jgi:hypothetical protein